MALWDQRWKWGAWLSIDKGLHCRFTGHPTLYTARTCMNLQSSLSKPGALISLCFEGTVFGVTENSQCKKLIQGSNDDQLPF